MSLDWADADVSAWVDAGMPLRWPEEEAAFAAYLQRREEALFKLGCAMRRHGAPPSVIEAALLRMNDALDGEPLSDESVRRTAASAGRYRAAEARARGPRAGGWTALR